VLKNIGKEGAQKKHFEVHMYEPRRSSEGCSEGCSEGSLEQTHKSMSTLRTCKNRCDMNVSYNDFDFGSRNH